MTRLRVFRQLINSERSIPDVVFSKFIKFSTGISLVIAACFVPPFALLVLFMSTLPYVVLFVISFIPCLLICALWHYWEEAGRLFAKGVDNLNDE